MPEQPNVAAAPVSNDPWGDVESVETSMIKFDTIGKVVVGLLIDRKMQGTKFGESPLYKLMTTDGSSASLFASGILDDKLSTQLGKIVRIEFTETVPSNKGNDAKLFDVKAMADTPENRAKAGFAADDGSTW